MSRIVTFGEIMGRLSAPGFKRFAQAMPGSLDVIFAGAEASIAGSIALLGGNASFVTALPKHPIADACVASLRSIGVDTRHILRTSEGRLGLYFLETGTNQRPANVIYDREGSSIAITPPQAYHWEAILKGADWLVVSGITPALSRNAANVTFSAMQTASQMGVRVLIDVNYRSKLWSWEPSIPPRELATRTLKEMLPLVDLFVGGREDLEALRGAQTNVSLEELVLEFARDFPRVQHVAMSLRESVSASHNNFGGMLFDKASHTFHYAPHKERFYPITHIVDRLGTGDAFTAGLLHALTSPDLAAPQTAIAFATAAGCLAHSIEGDCNFSTRSEVEALMNGDSAGRIRR